MIVAIIFIIIKIRIIIQSVIYIPLIINYNGLGRNKIMKCSIFLVWDNEAKVWFTRTNDIPGLCLEAESFDELIDDVRTAAPGLLVDNCNYEGPVHLIFEAVRTEIEMTVAS